MPRTHRPARLLAWAAVGASPIAFAAHWKAGTGAATFGIRGQIASKRR